jgi:hypothetical protein
VIKRGDGPPAEGVSVRHEVPVPAGVGMHYEADEVYRCLRNGKIESERMPWSESRLVQSWFDQIRGG